MDEHSERAVEYGSSGAGSCSPNQRRPIGGGRCDRGQCERLKTCAARARAFNINFGHHFLPSLNGR